jgi:hypothetical protein
MFKAMAMKELREVRGIGLLALAAQVYLAVAAVNPRLFLPGDRSPVPFVDDGFFLGWFVLISVATAIALGLRQTLGESIRGTYPFLLHRPAERRWLIGTKLLVGLAVSLTTGIVSILGYALWAATPGTHASPFEWSMTVPTWQMWLSMTPAYLGAFLTGIRPGRWYGRAFTLAAGCTIAVATVAAGIPLEAYIGSVMALVAPFAIALAGDLWLTSAILFTAKTRDYP